MKPRSSILLRAWNKIYYVLFLPKAPTKKDAAKAAGISEEKLNKDLEKLGVPFVKPVRKFWDVKEMDDFVVRFLEALEKKFGPSSTEPPPPPPPRRRSSPRPRRRRPEPGTTTV